jgi:hypothetical protein
MKETALLNVWVTIPILPCISIEETLSFWQMLGFDITYKQTHPYQYGVVARGGHELHFGRVKGMEAKNNSFTGCLVAIYDASKVYDDFVSIFRQRMGKVPHSGIPRISRMKPGATRFTLTDVAGNSVIFVSHGNQDQEVWEDANHKEQSRMRKAIATAARFRDYKNDDVAAAKTLDAALKQVKPEDDKVDIAEALVMRLELAGILNEPQVVEQLDARLNKMNLKGRVEALKAKHHTREST